MAFRLWEGWQTLQKAFFGSGVSQTYEPMLYPQASEALATLKGIFNKSTPLMIVRNEFSGHSDPDAVRAVLSEFSSDEQLDVFIPPYSTFANSFSALSERITESALLKRLPAGESQTPQAALKHLLEQAYEANQAFLRFLWGCILVAIGRHPTDWSASEMVLTDLPKLLDIRSRSLRLTRWWKRFRNSVPAATTLLPQSRALACVTRRPTEKKLGISCVADVA